MDSGLRAMSAGNGKSATTSQITLAAILEQFREDARSNRDLGDRFERLIIRFFQLDPIYADRFSDLWMWNEWPDKGNVDDVGIDLVARERATGEYCAIQCKFYLPEHTLAKEDIDSFFTAAGILVGIVDRSCGSTRRPFLRETAGGPS